MLKSPKMDVCVGGSESRQISESGNVVEKWPIE